MDILIDYLCYSSKMHSIVDLKEIMGIKELEYIAGKGRNGWTSCDYCNGIRIHYGNRDDIGIEMSGVGCRTLETANGGYFDWISFFDYVYENKGQMNVSRLDIACDDKEEVLSMRRLYSNTQRRHYISRARTCRWIQGDEEAIIFGSPSSDVRLRIYNKALERGVEGHWIRCEFQLRDESADSFIANLIERRDIGVVYGGVLNNYLRYTTENPENCNNNRSRIETELWWEKFVGTSERIRMVTSGGLEYNLEDLYFFLKGTSKKSLR